MKKSLVRFALAAGCFAVVLARGPLQPSPSLQADFGNCICEGDTYAYLYNPLFTFVAGTHILSVTNKPSSGDCFLNCQLAGYQEQFAVCDANNLFNGVGFVETQAHYSYFIAGHEFSGPMNIGYQDCDAQR